MYLKDISLPKLSTEQTELCTGEFIKKEVKDVLNKTENNKAPGNDGLTKEFFEMFWIEIKNLLPLSVKRCFLTLVRLGFLRVVFSGSSFFKLFQKFNF